MDLLISSLSRGMRDMTIANSMGLNYVESLSSSDDEVVMSALTQLCAQLNMYSVLPFFRTNSEALIPCITKCLRRPGDSDMNLLSARVLTYMVDSFPSVVECLSRDENLECLLYHFREIVDIELSEQCLTCAEKITDYPAGVRGMYRCNGISAMLTFSDFFTINSQRKIWCNIAKICTAVDPFHFDDIRTVLPTIRAGANSEDVSIRGSAIRAIVSILIGVRRVPSLVDETFGDIGSTLVPILLTQEKDEKLFLSALRLIQIAVGSSKEVIEKVVSDEVLYTLLTLLTGAAAAAAATTPSVEPNASTGEERSEGGDLPASKFSSFPSPFSSPSSASSSPLTRDTPSAAASCSLGSTNMTESPASPSSSTAISFLLRNKKIKLSLEDTRQLSGTFASLLPSVDNLYVSHVKYIREKELKITEAPSAIRAKAVGKKSLPHENGGYFDDANENESDDEEDTEDTLEDEFEEEEEEEYQNATEKEDWYSGIGRRGGLNTAKTRVSSSKSDGHAKDEKSVEATAFSKAGTRSGKDGKKDISPLIENEEEVKYRVSSGNKEKEKEKEGDNEEETRKKMNSAVSRSSQDPLKDITIIRNEDSFLYTLTNGRVCDMCDRPISVESGFHCNDCRDYDMCRSCFLESWKEHPSSHTFTDVGAIVAKAAEETRTSQISLQNSKIELYHEKPFLLERVLLAIPGVVQLSAETEVPSIRYFCLEYLIRAVHLASASQLLNAGISGAPLCETLSTAFQHPLLLTYLGIFLAGKLVEKIPWVYKELFLREGIVSSLQRLRMTPPHVKKLSYDIHVDGRSPSSWMKEMITSPVCALLEEFPAAVGQGRENHLIRLSQLLKNDETITPAFMLLRQIMLMGITTFELVTANVIHDLKEALVRRHSIFDMVSLVHILSVNVDNGTLQKADGNNASSASLRSANSHDKEMPSSPSTASASSSSAPPVLRSTPKINPLVRLVRHLHSILTFSDNFKAPTFGAVENMNSTITIKFLPDNSMYSQSTKKTPRRPSPTSNSMKDPRGKNERQTMSSLAAAAVEASRRGVLFPSSEYRNGLFAGVLSVNPLVDFGVMSKYILNELQLSARDDFLRVHRPWRSEESAENNPEHFPFPDASHGPMDTPSSDEWDDEGVEEEDTYDEDDESGSRSAAAAVANFVAETLREERAPPPAYSAPTTLWIRYKNKVFPPSMTLAQFSRMMEEEETSKMDTDESSKRTTASMGTSSASSSKEKKLTKRKAVTSKLTTRIAGDSNKKSGVTGVEKNTQNFIQRSPKGASDKPSDSEGKTKNGFKKEKKRNEKEEVAQEEEEEEVEVDDNDEEDDEEEGRNRPPHASLPSAFPSLSQRTRPPIQTEKYRVLHYSLAPYTGPKYEFIPPSPPIPEEVKKSQSAITLLLPTDEHFYPPAAWPVIQRLDHTYPWSRPFLTEEQKDVLTVLGVLYETVLHWGDIAHEVEQEVLQRIGKEYRNGGMEGGSGSRLHGEEKSPKSVPTMGGAERLQCHLPQEEGAPEKVKRRNSGTPSSATALSTLHTGTAAHRTSRLPKLEGSSGSGETTFSGTSALSPDSSVEEMHTEMPAQWLTSLCPPSLLPRDFCDQKLNNKAMQHCCNYLLAGHHLSIWAVNLALDCGFLFPPSTRKFMFDISFCGADRCLARIQRKVGDSGFFDSSSIDHRKAFSQRLQRLRMRVSRENILTYAMKVFGHKHTPGSVVWDFEFQGEEGLGSGPTKEFYALVSDALRLKTLHLWRSSDEEPSATHFIAPLGLFPRLLRPPPAPDSTTNEATALHHSSSSVHSECTTPLVGSKDAAQNVYGANAFAFSLSSSITGIISSINGRPWTELSSSAPPVVPPHALSGVPPPDENTPPNIDGTEDEKGLLCKWKTLEKWFALVGRFISRALLDDHLPALVLSPALLRLLRGDSCSLMDIRDVDPALYALLFAMVKAHLHQTHRVQIAGQSKAYLVDELGLDFTVDGVPLSFPSSSSSSSKKGHFTKPLPTPKALSQPPLFSSTTSEKVPKTKKSALEEKKAHTAHSHSVIPFTPSSVVDEDDAQKRGQDSRKTEVEEEVHLVCEDNMMLYCDGMVNTILRSGVKMAVMAMRKGFHDYIPLHALQMLTVEELHEVINGDERRVTKQEFSENCLANHGYTISSKPIQWLFDILSSFTVEEQKMFFLFLTGCEHLPIGGLASLNPKLTVVRKTSVEANIKESDQLPSAMTCQNYLKLPSYDSKEQMEAKIRQAMTEGQGSFHLT